MPRARWPTDARGRRCRTFCCWSRCIAAFQPPSKPTGLRRRSSVRMLFHPTRRSPEVQASLPRRRLSGPAAVCTIRRSKPGHSLVSIREASVTDAHLREDFLGVAETVETRRHAAIDRDLQENLAQLGFGDAVVEGATNVDLEFLRPLEGCDYA